jgi:hypothetical protein
MTVALPRSSPRESQDVAVRGIVAAGAREVSTLHEPDPQIPCGYAAGLNTYSRGWASRVAHVRYFQDDPGSAVVSGSGRHFQLTTLISVWSSHATAISAIP